MRINRLPFAGTHFSMGMQEAQATIAREDLVREVARVVGYQRTGVNVTQSLLRGITYLLKSRRARKETDGRILIPS